jgi:hypothetical protein
MTKFQDDILILFTQNAFVPSLEFAVGESQCMVVVDSTKSPTIHYNGDNIVLNTFQQTLTSSLSTINYLQIQTTIFADTVYIELFVT